MKRAPCGGHPACHRSAGSAPVCRLRRAVLPASSIEKVGRRNPLRKRKIWGFTPPDTPTCSGRPIRPARLSPNEVATRIIRASLKTSVFVAVDVRCCLLLLTCARAREDARALREPQANATARRYTAALRQPSGPASASPGAPGTQDGQCHRCNTPRCARDTPATRRPSAGIEDVDTGRQRGNDRHARMAGSKGGGGAYPWASLGQGSQLVTAQNALITARLELSPLYSTRLALRTGSYRKLAVSSDHRG